MFSRQQRETREHRKKIPHAVPLYDSGGCPECGTLRQRKGEKKEESRKASRRNKSELWHSSSSANSLESCLALLFCIYLSTANQLQPAGRRKETLCLLDQRDITGGESDLSPKQQTRLSAKRNLSSFPDTQRGSGERTSVIRRDGRES